MKQRLCLILAVSSVANGLWSQTTTDSSAQNSAQGTFTGQSAPQLRVRPVTWKQLVPNIAKDQKHIWTFPFRIGQGNNWAPALGVSAITVGLVAADPYNAPYFRNTNSFHRFNSIATANVSAISSVIAPIGFYVTGMIRKDSYAKETALLAGEAIADVQILSLVMHTADRRIRPRNLPTTSNYRDTWFKNKVSFVRGSGSFPSGHALSAFAVATVISRRYPKHRWVPYVVYGLAGIVGFSKITESDHFTSDVFFGAAAGYSISRFSVLQR
jgi:membrane-associated phospholipid phosphatase